MRVLFMGTPEIAVAALEALAAEHEVIGAFCQPDKPQGRKMIMTPPPVKLAAEKLGIPVFQPKSLRTDASKQLIKDLNPDVICLKAYGKLLPKEVLETPKFGCINAHASLLPKYRGASPIQHAILCGETVTGVTAMLMDEGMDTGDMMGSISVDILPEDDEQSMFEKLAPVGAQLLCDTLKKLESGTAVRVPQNNDEATYAPIIDKSMALFSFADDAKSIVNKVRAFSVWPNAFFELNGVNIKVFKAAYSESNAEAGTVVSTNPLVIAANNGAVEIKEMMPAGRKRMTGAAYSAGARLKKGDNILAAEQ